MTGTEAVKHLKDFLNSPEYEEPTAEQLEAIETAICLLSKKHKLSNERDEELKQVTYGDLKPGDLFKMSNRKNDLIIYRRDEEGATQIRDKFGKEKSWKCFTFYSMEVYINDKL